MAPEKEAIRRAVARVEPEEDEHVAWSKARHVHIREDRVAGGDRPAPGQAGTDGPAIDEHDPLDRLAAAHPGPAVEAGHQRVGQRLRAPGGNGEPLVLADHAQQPAQEPAQRSLG